VTLNRYAKRKDSSQSEIVAALRQAGCDVEVQDVIELTVGRGSMNYLLECKNPGWTESDLTPTQKRLRATWRGQYTIVATVAEALKAVGL
jgi:hypothetical protein